jgi:hypothetical protein
MARIKQTARVAGSGDEEEDWNIRVSTPRDDEAESSHAFMEALAGSRALWPTTEFSGKSDDGSDDSCADEGSRDEDEAEVPTGERGAGDGAEIELTEALHATIDAVEATTTGGGVTYFLGNSSITLSKIATFVEHGYFGKG